MHGATFQHLPTDFARQARQELDGLHAEIRAVVNARFDSILVLLEKQLSAGARVQPPAVASPQDRPQRPGKRQLSGRLRQALSEDSLSETLKDTPKDTLKDKSLGANGVQSVQDMKAAFLNVLKDAETCNGKQERDSDKCRKEERTAVLSRSGTTQSDSQDAPVSASAISDAAPCLSPLGAERPARKLRPLQAANCRHKASEEKFNEEMNSEDKGADNKQGAADTHRMSTVGQLPLTSTNIAHLQEACDDDQQRTLLGVPLTTARMPAQAFDSVSSELLGLTNPWQLHNQATKVPPGNAAHGSQSRMEGKAFISCKSDEIIRTWELPVDLMYQNSNGAAPASLLEKERAIHNAVKAMLQGQHLTPGESFAGPQQSSSSSTAPAAPVAPAAPAAPTAPAATAALAAPQTAWSKDVTLPCLPGAQSMASSAPKQAASQSLSDRPSHAGGHNPVVGPPDDAKSSCQDADDGAVGGATGAGPTKRLEVTAFFSWQSDIPVFHQDPLTALLSGKAEIPGQIEPE